MLDARRKPTAFLLAVLAGLAGVAGAGCSDESGQTAGPSSTRPGHSSPSPKTPSKPPPTGPTPTASAPTTPAQPASPSPRPDAVPKLKPVVSRTVTTGLTSPWELVFLPNGSALLSERDTGRLKRIAPDGSVSTVGTLPGISHGNEGGLLGLALSPSYERDRLLYAYLTTASDNRVVRMTYDEGDLGSPRVVLAGIPRGPDSRHNGGRLVFGPDGLLYVSTGDGELSSRAQDRTSLGGKILRITPDGKPANRNPFGNEVWSYGHRNVEGLAFDAQGRLWASEFGDKGADELNLIRKGGNYGWPELEGTGGRSSGFVDPAKTWAIEEASPSGIAYTDGAIWMAALRGERLWRIRVDGPRVEGTKAFHTGDYGRLRTIVTAPDGSLRLITSNTDGRVVPRPGDDRILRLTLR